MKGKQLVETREGRFGSLVSVAETLHCRRNIHERKAELLFS